MSRRRRARIGGLPRVGQQVPLDPRRLRHGARATSSVGTRTPLQRQKTCRAFSSGRAETRVSGETTTRGRPTRHSRARATLRSDPFMRPARLSSPSIVLAALALALACVPAEATVRVRPVESTVILEGVVVRDFRSRALQLDFCRAFTGVIDLDARVRQSRSTHVSRARPSHPPLSPHAVPGTPRPPPKNRRIDTPLGRSETTGSRTPRHPP